MSTSSITLADKVQNYLVETARVGESELKVRLRAETATLPMARMQISVEQGRLMSMLTSLLGVRRAIEVGVFTGYSALCVAERLPKDGRLLACDVSEEWTAIARRYWAEAGVADKIDLRIAPAHETLQSVIDAGEAGTWDFAFIDADKTGYDTYYEDCLVLLKPGGLIAIDNAFFGGDVADAEPAGEGAKAIRKLTEKIARDPRADPALVPIGDGLLLVRKR